MEEKKHGSSFNVTMASYHGAIGIYIQSLLESTLEKDQMGFYRDDGIDL